MPSSQLSQLTDIIELIIFTNPKTILDIGVGFGKYGYLSREYLDVWSRKKDYNKWTVRIDGIEAFEQYLTPAHNYIYDHIYIGNAINILPTLIINYDLILIIDVLEHLDYNEGLIFLKECIKCGKNLIVSTPKAIGTQDIVFNNPYERHKFQWGKKHFNDFINRCFIPNDISLICYIGENTPKLRKARINRKMGIILPFMIPIVKNIKNYFNLKKK